MTITLEQIEGMKIPVGTPIELTFVNKPIKNIGYFAGVENGVIKYTLSQKINNPEKYGFEIKSEFESDIESIKILEYKK